MGKHKGVAVPSGSQGPCASGSLTRRGQLPARWIRHGRVGGREERGSASATTGVGSDAAGMGPRDTRAVVSRCRHQQTVAGHFNYTP